MKVVLENLTKRFPGRSKKDETVTAVDHFSFEIPDGQLIGLLGPSGCGKSTTLNLISGLETPTEGKIFFGDEDVTDLPPEARGVGLVFQNYALYPHLTVEENIIFPLENLKGAKKLTKEAMHEKAMEAARLVQIDTLMERKPKELSGGQQQRVAIARALVKIPRVLLLDEPLSNLDARLRLQTREELRRIQRETGVTTIFVTHDQEEAMSISDLIIVMKSGKVHQIGKPQDVYDELRSSSARRRSTSSRARSETARYGSARRRCWTWQERQTGTCGLAFARKALFRIRKDLLPAKWIASRLWDGTSASFPRMKR